MNDVESWRRGIQGRVEPSVQGGTMVVENVDEMSMLHNVAHLIADASLDLVGLPDPRPPRYKLDLMGKTDHAIRAALDAGMAQIGMFSDQRWKLSRGGAPLDIIGKDLPDINLGIKLVLRFKTNPVGTLVTVSVQFTIPESGETFMMTHPCCGFQRL